MLAIGRATNDQMTVAHALRRLSYLASLRNDHEQAVALADESLALSRQLQDEASLRGSLHSRALVAAGLGDFGQAEELWEACLVLVRELRLGYFASHNLYWLGHMTRARGDLDGALARYQEAAEVFRQHDDKL